MIPIEKAFERLYWRFGGKQAFNPNKNDLEALNRIAEFVNNLSDQKTKNHQLFAKMYVRRLTELFGNYRDLSFSLSASEMECSLPLSHYIDLFHFEYNLNKYKMYCEKEGLRWDEMDLSDEKTRKYALELIMDDKDYQKHVLGYWSIDKIERSISKQLIEVIEKHESKI